MMTISSRIRGWVFVWLSITLFVCSPTSAQLKVALATDKRSYEYGESITTTCTVTNNADTAVTIWQPWQGPLTGTTFDGVPIDWIILPTSIPYTYASHASRTWALKLDMTQLGLPNKQGTHTIVCYYSGDTIFGKDSVTIEQPVFYGGQVMVTFSISMPATQIQSLRDSMHASVATSQTIGQTVIERWNTSGFILDSLVAKYSGDSRLLSIQADRSISPPTTVAQINRKPVFVWHSPISVAVSSGIPFTFKVSAYDPEGEPVTFTWKRDGVVVKSGADTSYTTTFIGPYGEPHNVVCIAADPEGLQDSVVFLFTITDIQDEKSPIPGEFSLMQNYPNPFNPSTTIRYELPTAADVSLRIYNTLGQLVAILVNAHKQAGDYEVQWTANVPSGIYFYRLQAGDFVETKKMILLR